MQAAVVTEHLTYSYPAQEGQTAPPVFEDLNLNITQGSFVAVLGHNGCGKSTLAKHLNAILLPSGGKVYVYGMDTTDEDRLMDIRKTVGMVFQNPDNQIIASVVEEDVAFGLENTAVPTEEIKRKVPAALESVGMADYAKASPNRLSGGQKQRVAVAGILAMSPRCIVLDEATAMLDPRGRSEVMDTVTKLNKEKNITIIAITHYMDEALMADKIFVMGNGSILLSGTPREVFKETETLEELGLRLPEICRLAKELREAGLPVPEDVLYEEELKECIMNYALNK